MRPDTGAAAEAQQQRQRPTTMVSEEQLSSIVQLNLLERVENLAIYIVFRSYLRPLVERDVVVVVCEILVLSPMDDDAGDDFLFRQAYIRRFMRLTSTQYSEASSS